MYLQEGEEGSYRIVGLKKSETQEREGKKKEKIPNHLDCQQVMGVQPAWWGCVRLEPDLLTLQMNCPGIFLSVVMLQAGKTLSVYLPNPFFTLPHRKPNSSVCSGDLPLLALASMVKTRSSKPSVAGDTNSPLPSPAIQHLLLQEPQGGAKQLRAALVPAPRVSGFCLLKAILSLLLSVLGTERDTLMIQQALNFRIWSPENQAIPCPVLQSTFICVSDYSYSFH